MLGLSWGHVPPQTNLHPMSLSDAQTTCCNRSQSLLPLSFQTTGTSGRPQSKLLVGMDLSVHQTLPIYACPSYQSMKSVGTDVNKCPKCSIEIHLGAAICPQIGVSGRAKPRPNHRLCLGQPPKIVSFQAAGNLSWHDPKLAETKASTGKSERNSDRARNGAPVTSRSYGGSLEPCPESPKPGV